jgi:UDP-N-acetylglucosamine 2-epimerase (non-hydrolysing)
VNVLVPLGTRPEIVKLAPVVAALRDRGVGVRVVATGQHTDPNLSDAFFDDLGLQPDDRWQLAGDEPARVAAILEAAYRELADHRPDAVVLLGDTNTVPLFCLAARRHRVPVVHLEAGLRSFNPTSLEEVNRRVAAATAALHLAPTDQAARFLEAEGVAAERIRVVGNPGLDVVRTSGVAPVPVAERAGMVLTAHRATNVDDPQRLEALVKLALRLADAAGPVTLTLHPRTRARLEAAGAMAALADGGVRLVDPLPYHEMLRLVASSRVAVTDSGGLQEEAAWVGVPVVVLRRSTPRWEGVAAGTSVLVGLDVDRALEAVERLCTPEEQARIAAAPCPYGDGRTAERVADLLADPAIAPLLAIDEPDFVDREPPA